MALFKLQLPFGSAGQSSEAALDGVVPPATDASAGAAKAGGQLPFIGHLPPEQQLRRLGWTLAGLVLVMLVIATYVLRQTAVGANYVAAATQMQTLSQRIAKGAQQVLLGGPEGVSELSASRSGFGRIVTSLQTGGDVGFGSVPPTSGAPTEPLARVEALWTPTDKNSGDVLKFQKSLADIGAAVKLINQRNPELLDIAEQIVSLKLQTGGGAREISLSGQLVMLTQRIAKNANALLASDVIDPESSYLLARDSQVFRETTSRLLNGSDSPRVPPTRDQETQQKLQELDSAFREFQAGVATILSNLQNLLAAKQAARVLVSDSAKLLTATGELSAAYQEQLDNTRGWYFVLGVLAILAAFVLVLIGRAIRADAQRRAEEAARQAAEAERVNRQNQDAILRLMNEMSAVADGDLTIRATVSEDITGAIADSVNFTVEELRALVGRVTTAATQVTTASSQARETSDRLLEAAELQSQQIQEASASVLRMARAINDVSASASRSVSVARQSLAASEQGTTAVENAISGMNDIRAQIQETSKRIKRLGESSQQIGEIVELISDITERTQVLALNAAIQAAAAGDAGRGFTVVAEEVQRLAERSGEATRQIAGIVKTIQTDTLDAASAMERSTSGVVQGARLSDAAGQALSEIGEVSKRLAALIEEISSTAQAQAHAAGKVATGMQEILSINKQTSEGTKQTASSVGELAELASELRASVSNFKI
jgi:twitching motility protein PilJ